MVNKTPKKLLFWTFILLILVTVVTVVIATVGNGTNILSFAATSLSSCSSSGSKLTYKSIRGSTTYTCTGTKTTPQLCNGEKWYCCSKKWQRTLCSVSLGVKCASGFVTCGSTCCNTRTQDCRGSSSVGYACYARTTTTIAPKISCTCQSSINNPDILKKTEKNETTAYGCSTAKEGSSQPCCTKTYYCCSNKWKTSKCSVPTAKVTQPVVIQNNGGGGNNSAGGSGGTQAGGTAASTVPQTGCYDYACQNIKQGNYWGIVNCAVPDEPDGAMELCSWKGRSTQCRGMDFCCPDEGSQWTTDMTACPTPSVSSTPTPVEDEKENLCACPTPSLPFYQTSNCNGPCMTNYNCSNNRACLFINDYGWVCRNPACVESSSCACTTSTPTPKPEELSYCDEPCLATADCESGLRCSSVNNIKVCRNPKCVANENCLCLTSTGGSGLAKGITPTSILTPDPIEIATISSTPTPTILLLAALPTLTPTPTPAPINPTLTINPFTDTSGNTSPTFTVTGTSDPFVEIDIQFNPDAVGQRTTADDKGDFRIILTKGLTTGRKELTAIARTADGGETQVKQSFSVKKSSSFFSLFLGFLVIAGLGLVGYIIYQKQMKDQSSLFTEFPAETPFTGPETESPPPEDVTTTPETQQFPPSENESEMPTIFSEPTNEEPPSSQ